MGKILCFIYDQLAEFEVTLLLHRINKIGGKEIIPIGYDLEPVTSTAGLIHKAAATVEQALEFEDVEALIIPGGQIQEQKPEITKLIQKLYNEKKLIASICFGPQFLGRAGILDDHKFTTSCKEAHIQSLGVQDPYPRVNFQKQRVVRDGNVITAQWYAFVDFAIEVCDYLNILSKEEQEELTGAFKGDGYKT